METANQYSYIDQAIAGLIADLQEAKIDSRANTDTSSMPYGIGVVHVSTDPDKGVRLPTPSNWSGSIEGITTFSQPVNTLGIPNFAIDSGTQNAFSGSETGPVNPGDVVNVMREGRINVFVEAAVAKGGPVFMRLSANGSLTQLGAFRGDADSGNAVQIAGAFFDSTVASGNVGTGNGYALVKFDAVAQAAAAEVVSSIQFEMNLASIAPGAMAKWTPGFDGIIKSIQATVNVAATTSGKAATLTPAIAGTDVTGGALALTSANCTPVGAEIDGSPITGANIFNSTQQLSLVASGVTTFDEGAVTVTVEYIRV